MNERKQRLTPRQSQAQEARNRSNQRRHATTVAIRKQKKSEYLARKRGLKTLETAAASQDQASADCANRLSQYIAAPNDASLASLYEATSKLSAANSAINDRSATSVRPQAANPLVFEDDDQRILDGQKLIAVLKSHLQSVAVQMGPSLQGAAPAPATAQKQVRTILQLLVLLSSMPNRNSSTSTGYYGKTPTTWCTLIAGEHHSTSAAASVVTSSAPTAPPLIVALRDLLQHIHTQSNTAGGVQSLDDKCAMADSICMVFGNLAGDDGEVARNAMKQARISFTLTQILRQFATSLNANHAVATPNQPNQIGEIRVASTAAWALTNLVRNDPTAFARDYCSEELLSASLLKVLVEQPHDIALSTQSAWIIASVTSREEDVVNYLCKHDAAFCPTLAQALGRRLAMTDVHVQQVLPLIQSIGHIASFEEYITPLLTSTSLIDTMLKLFERMMASEYGFLESLPSSWSRSDVTQLLVHLSWLCGCLLLDARKVGHASTNVAFPKLAPPLFDMFIRYQNNGLVLEEMSAILRALWNAWDIPPFDPNYPQLLHLQECPCRNGLIDLLPCLVDLIAPLLRSDMDSLMKVLLFMDMTLRNSDSITYLRQHLEELQIVEKLEMICDDHVIPNNISEIAANLLDDFFDGNDYEEDDIHLMPESTSNGETFAFGLDSSSTPLTFGGMGRGRGAVMPSWMSQS